MKKTFWLSGIVLIFYSCNPAAKNQNDTLNYFDIKGYFEKEALRLNKNNPLLTKTVVVNGAAETRKIHIPDWKKELSIFSDAEINRSAWKGLFGTTKNNEQELYTSDNEKVPVKEVLITKRNGRVYGIRILVKNTNMLYNSADTLSYYPDSLYQINKKQHIKLMAAKNYSITGKFK
ncbi:MAG: hypothetical protein P0Y49_04100 [Candidatus Pedobacter colombiensis]|uniref:Uncharacterized protein n=1 Tax=Candidatus Pedobacter colombiensis TaxID=3121371 RepID=A0AAJ5WAY9_9SPHI|nr:hypothetical protein [Pedobacter sp.]WEK20321.1 MAG: hypothetical protein P0Y49_04100 [Pedobacter sp.]